MGTTIELVDSRYVTVRGTDEEGKLFVNILTFSDTKNARDHIDNFLKGAALNGKTVTEISKDVWEVI